MLLAQEQYSRAQTEHSCGEQVREPETNVSLGVDHGDLTDKRTDIDHHVEVHVDTGNSGRRVNNDTLTGSKCRDIGPVLAILLCNQGGDVGLETTSSYTHDDKTNREACNGSVGTVNNFGNGGNDENDVSNECTGNRGHDGTVTTPPLISNHGTKERHDVGPEGVDCAD